MQSEWPTTWQENHGRPSLGCEWGYSRFPDVYSRGSLIADAERVLRALLGSDGEMLPVSIRAKALLLLGRSLTVQKHYPQARDTLEQALETMLEAYGPTNYFVHATQTAISTLYSLVDEHAAALIKRSRATTASLRYSEQIIRSYGSPSRSGHRRIFMPVKARLRWKTGARLMLACVANSVPNRQW